MIRLLYFCYSLYPIFLIVNFIRYFGYKISPYAHIFFSKIDPSTEIRGKCLMEHSEVGKYTAISGDILGSSYSQIRHTKIGNYCSIGPNFVTLPYGHNYNNISTYLFKRNDKSEIFNEIIIDNDVWIGSNVIILGGVKIANGSVIGAGSVVTKDTQPYSIYVGNPAKLLKYRFHKKKINELLKSAWWNKTKDPYE